MNNIFDSENWEIEKDINIISESDNMYNLKMKQTNQVTYKYKNLINYDEIVRIDINFSGKLIINLNDHFEEITSNNSTCVLNVSNCCLECNNIKSKIDEKDINILKITLFENTIVNSFLIIQELKINSCNPEN